MDQPGNPVFADSLEVRLKRLSLIARITDTAISVPGTGVKLGLDAVIGAVPVVGDLAMAVLGLVIVYDAHKLGVPKRDLLRMLRNVVLDTSIGAVPFIGDLFDLVYRSNERNIRIIEKHVGKIDARFVDVIP